MSPGRRLQVLDMANQKSGFTGSIPEDLEKLQFLKKLNLAGNKLIGNIPLGMLGGE